jgi:hypothetical protein
VCVGEGGGRRESGSGRADEVQYQTSNGDLGGDELIFVFFSFFFFFLLERDWGMFASQAR